MRKLFQPRSRLSRGLMALALLAWAMVAFGAFARPSPMGIPGMTRATPEAMAVPGTMGANCDDMAHRLHPSAPAQPMNGHDCCQGGCYCSSSCAVIVGASPSLMAWQPVRGTVIRPIHSEPGLAPAAPPLRPPIV